MVFDGMRCKDISLKCEKSTLRAFEASNLECFDGVNLPGIIHVFSENQVKHLYLDNVESYEKSHRKYCTYISSILMS